MNYVYWSFGFCSFPGSGDIGQSLDSTKRRAPPRIDLGSKDAILRVNVMRNKLASPGD